LDVLNPLIQVSKEFGGFYCRFFYRGFSESSKETRATIEGGDAQGSQSPFLVTK
jgi:hypothetical protein